MAFTLDPDTDRGRVRLLVSDTDTATAANQIFTDTEIDAFLSLENNEVYPAAAAAAESIAASSARSAIAYRALDERVDKKQIPREFRALAESYRERAKTVPAEEIDSLDYELGAFGSQAGEFVGDTVA